MNEGRGLPPVTAQSRILEEGFVDSFGLIELFGKIEEAFQVRLEDQDLSKENFETVESLARFLQRKRREQTP